VGRGSPTRPTPGKPARGRSNNPQSPLGWFNSLGTRLLFRHALVKATSHTANRQPCPGSLRRLRVRTPTPREPTPCRYAPSLRCEIGGIRSLG
jgi:hypothetical protein